MTTSRIYAYRWPARLVSHKPFAAERYFITSACIWQVFFEKNRNFLFYFLRTVFCAIFCAFRTTGSSFGRGKLPFSQYFPFCAAGFIFRHKNALPEGTAFAAGRAWAPHCAFYYIGKETHEFLTGRPGHRRSLPCHSLSFLPDHRPGSGPHPGTRHGRHFPAGRCSGS